MTKVSRKGFVDKNGQQVVIVPNVPGATEGNIPKFDADGNLQDSGISAGLVGKEIHTLEYNDCSYESRISAGKLNRDDDELDGSSVYGKDAIHLGVYGNRVFIDGDNINNLKRALVTPSSAPEDDAAKLITSKAVYDAINEVKERIGTPTIIIDLYQDSGDSYYFLFGNSGDGINTTNINSVKNFIQTTQQNTIVLCNVHVTHRSGASGVPDDEYNIPGYAMWSLLDDGRKIKVRLVVLGYVFSCEVVGDLNDADSYSDHWTKTSFTL